MIIDGTTIAKEIIESLKQHPAPQGFFGVALVGEDPASLRFIEQKKKAALLLGVDFRFYDLPADITTDELRRQIGRLAEPKKCSGFIVQLPLPGKINRYYALNAIPKEKDPDLLSEAALGAFYTGRRAIVPPSVAVVEEVFRREKRTLRELRVAVIGAGFLIGKPVGFWLQDKVAELMVFDRSVKNMKEQLKDADVVISGAGSPDLFSAEDIKEGTLVIDFGYNRKDGKTVGDFNPEGADEKKIIYTKTPGGTGPILVAKLFENYYALNG